MYGTRLLSRAAPATDLAERPTLLIVAHGERGGDGNDQFAHAVARNLADLPDYADIKVCFISKEPTLKQTFETLPDQPVVIYPLFMSDGYFVRTAIPRSLACKAGHELVDDGRVAILQPMGLHPRLPDVVANIARNTASDVGLDCADCTLLLVAHGSQHNNASRRATVTIGNAIERAQTFAVVALSFLEEYPFLDQQITAIDGPIIASGLFAGEGMHGGDDLNSAVNAADRPDLHITPPLTRSLSVVGLLRTDLDLKGVGSLGWIGLLCVPRESRVEIDWYGNSLTHQANGNTFR